MPTCAPAAIPPSGHSTAATLAAMTELSQADLGKLVEEAIVDAYGEDEQLAGFYTMIEENLAVPFTTRVLGVEVTVAGGGGGGGCLSVLGEPGMRASKGITSSSRWTVR